MVFHSPVHYKLYWVVLNHMFFTEMMGIRVPKYIYSKCPHISLFYSKRHLKSLAWFLWKSVIVLACWQRLIRFFSRQRKKKKSILYKQTWWIRNLYSVWILISFILAGFDSSRTKKKIHTIYRNGFFFFHF